MSTSDTGTKYRLEPRDEFTHDPGDALNYNESMYFNAFDMKTGFGAWFRLGNRPNEGYAEMSVCLYLPDGRVAFMFDRPKIDNNDEMNAGGMKIEVAEPFKKLIVTFEGKALVMTEPTQMADPKVAFTSNPKLPCTFELHYTGESPMYGGETVNADGSPIEIDPEKSFAKAHYEQHCSVKGTIRIGDETFEMDGLGLRDKSWGPRYWQAIEWYRWCPMNFSPDFGMMFTVMGNGKGGSGASGMVFRDGIYDLVTDCELDIDWGDDEYQTGLRAKVTTEAGKVYNVTGEVKSLIPLRNRRKSPDGSEYMTRLTEGLTTYECEGMSGYGMSEFLDQIIDGKAVGRAGGY